jgi:quercetin dioxygenase-like cupin family protein
MPVLTSENSNIEKIDFHKDRQIIHLENMMTVIIDFKNGPMIEPEPPHSHPHEQISFVADGELLVFLGSEKYQLKKGDIFAVPSDMPHCIQTLSENVRLVDTFTPIRKDFLK